MNLKNKIIFFVEFNYNLYINMKILTRIIVIFVWETIVSNDSPEQSSVIAPPQAEGGFITLN